jgi:hypothetical protein
MRWAAPERYPGYWLLRSECGNYTVIAEKIGQRWRYAAYTRPSPFIAPCLVLGWLWEKPEAIGLCEAHERSRMAGSGVTL